MPTATDPSTRLPLDSHTLHIVEQGDLGWVVWFNLHDIDFSGLMIGTGKTRNDAVGAAVRTLEAAVEVLQRPPVTETVTCDECKGHGVIGQSGKRWSPKSGFKSIEDYVIYGTCTMCGGSGKRERPRQQPPAGKVCWMCHGSGYDDHVTTLPACSVCSGTGRLG